jgi:hypothetical protein
LLSTAGVCAAAAYPVSRWAVEGGFAAMALAAGIVLAGALVGFVPLSRARTTEGRVQAAMVGFGLRIFVTLAGIATVWFTGSAPHGGAFLSTAGAVYAVLLVVEVVFAARLVGPGSAVPA